MTAQSDIRGIVFADVYSKDGKRCSEIYQLKSINEIEAEAIALGYGEQQLSCPVCKKRQIGLPPAYELHLNLKSEELTDDFYITSKMFGEGIEEPLYIISQKFYKLLLAEGLTGDLDVSPVILC